MVLTRISSRRSLPIALFTYLMFAACLGRATTLSAVTGTWRGTSVCVQTDSPCHDEVNVFRFSEIAGKPNKFLCTGSKVVDGKEIEMGPLEWTFNPEYHALEAQVSGNAFRLIVMGNRMEGTLKTANNVTYRRIHLERAE